jgi:hypothetical protein
VKILLQRDTFTDRSTTGTVYLDGQQFCWSLELPNKDGLPGSCIPQGTYPVTAQMSPRFGRSMPHIQDIPNRSEILIHWGNNPEDTEGCILLGLTRDTDYVGNSRMAFDDFWGKFMPALASGTVTLTVIGGAKVPESSGDIHLGDMT